MKSDVIQVAPDTSIKAAKVLLEQHGFRHLPVTDNGILQGIITREDLLNALPSPLNTTGIEDHIIGEQGKVASFMTTHPLTVTKMTPLEEVARILQKHKIGGIPVVEEDSLVGIITETDIFAAFQAIMAGKDGDTRIEMLIPKKKESFYNVIHCCRTENVCINSLCLYGGYSTSQQLLTIRVNGRNIDTLVDALWESGAKINKIIQIDDSGNGSMEMDG